MKCLLGKSGGSSLCNFNNPFIRQNLEQQGHRQTKLQCARTLDQFSYGLGCRWRATIYAYLSFYA
jgi:hypothetical protein